MYEAQILLSWHGSSGIQGALRQRTSGGRVLERPEVAAPKVQFAFINDTFFSYER